MSDVKEIKTNSKIKIGFIADGVKNFSKKDIFHDSSFALMLAAQEFDTKILLTESNDLKIINNKVFAKFDEVNVRQVAGSHIAVKKSPEYSLHSLDIIFARKDPPVNANYISYIQTLCLLSQHNNSQENKQLKPLIINRPEGVLKANEKLYALNFPDFIPPTLVSSKNIEILNFLNEHKEAVIKPLFEKGGDEVFYLNKNIKNCHSIIEISTQNESRVALIQKFLPEVVNGDKRIILLNGIPLGALLRIPKATELRANMSRGATIKHCELTKRDLEICEALKSPLQKDGLYFTGIDVIGNYLTEVNVTSPTCIQEIERFTGRSLAKEIISWAIENCSANIKKFTKKRDLH